MVDLKQEFNKEAQKTISQNAGKMRYSDDELREIKNLFKDRDDRLKLLEKIFLPQITDGAPLGMINDLYFALGAEVYKEMPAEDVKIMFLARNTLIQHINSILLMLQVLANRKDETPEERAKRLANNSTK